MTGLQPPGRQVARLDSTRAGSLGWRALSAGSGGAGAAPSLILYSSWHCPQGQVSKRKPARGPVFIWRDPSTVKQGRTADSVSSHGRRLSGRPAPCPRAAPPSTSSGPGGWPSARSRICS